MKKNFGQATLALALTIVLFIAPAHADEYDCRSSVGLITVDNLRVPQGEICILDGTRVEGTIKVEADATLLADQVRVVGNIQAENAAQVEVLSGSMVGGSIQIKQGGGAIIDSAVINSDLQFDDNRRNLIANKNTIGGNLQAFQNTGGLSITENTIDGNLQCKENFPEPTGGDNIVMGSMEDQCANLSPAAEPIQLPTEEPIQLPAGTQTSGSGDGGGGCFIGILADIFE